MSPARRYSICIPAMMLCSSTSGTWSATARRSSRTAGIGRRPATPSAIVATRSVSTRAFALHDKAIAGRASWLHADDLDRRGEAFEDVPHARRHGAAAKSDEDRIGADAALDEFEADRPGPLAGIEVLAVLDEERAFRGRHLSRQAARIVEVAVDRPHARAQSADALQLMGVGPRPGDDGDADPAT